MYGSVKLEQCSQTRIAGGPISDLYLPCKGSSVPGYCSMMIGIPHRDDAANTIIMVYKRTHCYILFFHLD